MVRVGIGYDLHRLEAGRRLVLGSIVIPFEAGLAGHSDGDVVLHAVIDALLGAAGLPDRADLEILAPTNLAAANGTLLYDVNNRGRWCSEKDRHLWQADEDWSRYC